MSEPITKKERKRARSKWDEFQDECKSMSALRGRKPPSDMNKYYNKIYKAEKDKIGENEAWVKALNACVDKGDVVPVSEPMTTSTSKSKSKTQTLPPANPPIPPPSPSPQVPQVDMNKIKQEFTELFSNAMKKQEERNSKRLQRLNEAIQKLGMSGEENKELVKKLMKDATEQAVSRATEKVADVIMMPEKDVKNVISRNVLDEEIEEVNEKVDENKEELKQFFAEAMNKLGDRIEELNEEVKNLREQPKSNEELLEQQKNLTEPRSPIVSTEGIEEDTEIMNKIKEIEGVCEQMFPILNEKELTENCNQFTSKQDECNAQASCYFYEPNFFNSLIFGEQKVCKPRPEIVEMLPGQVDEYIQCKTEQGEEVPAKIKRLALRQQQLRQLQQLQTQKQLQQKQIQPQRELQNRQLPQPQQPEDVNFERLKQTRQELLDMGQELTDSQMGLNTHADILDAPLDRSNIRLPPLLQDVPAAPPVQPPIQRRNELEDGSDGDGEQLPQLQDNQLDLPQIEYGQRDDDMALPLLPPDMNTEEPLQLPEIQGINLPPDMNELNVPQIEDGGDGTQNLDIISQIEEPPQPPQLQQPPENQPRRLQQDQPLELQY